jgi:xylan 1,4-beta-xylosidase
VDLSQPIAMPGRTAGPHGMPHSSTFAKGDMGRLWSLYASAPDEKDRYRIEPGALILKGKGSSPRDGSVLTQQVGDRAFEISVELDVRGDSEGGLLLFFNDRLFLGMGIDGKRMVTYRGGKAAYWPEPAPPARRMHMKIVNDHQIVTFYYSLDGRQWTRHGIRSQVTGYNANTIDDLLSLRPGLFAAGTGDVAFRDFRYRSL